MSSVRKLFIYSSGDGFFSQIHLKIGGLGSEFVVRFMTILGATPVQFACFTMITQLSQIFQILGILISNKLKSRKKPVLKYLFIGRFLTLFFGFFALGLNFKINSILLVWVFLSFFFFSALFQAIGQNLWIAWIADVIPIYLRGRFFSFRTQFSMLGGLFAGYFCGFIMDLLVPNADKKSFFAKFFPSIKPFTDGEIWLFFLGLFAFASISGLLSLLFLKRQPDFHQEIISQENIGKTFLEPFKDKNFRYLLFFGMWWMLAVGVGAPFWQPFMINNLKMTMIQMQIYGTLGAVASLIMLRSWGKLIDNFGNKTAMAICIIIGAINPLPWLFVTPERIWLIYLEGISSGMMWSGVGIVISNFVLSIAPPKSQQVYSGINSAFTGLGWAATAFCSGFFYPENGFNLFGNHLGPEQTLFGLTSLTRLSAIIPLFFIYEKKAEWFDKFIKIKKLRE